MPARTGGSSPRGRRVDVGFRLRVPLASCGAMPAEHADRGREGAAPTGSTRPCLACGGVSWAPLVRIPSIPVVANELLPSRERALGVARGEMLLAHCASCGLFFNAAFDERRIEYGGTYENALHFSPRFREYAEDLARELASAFRIRGGRVLEIGAGDGRLLTRLCELGASEGIGFDPAHDPSRTEVPAGAPVRIVRARFGPESAPPAARLVLTRHVLEHVPRPRAFLEDVRRVLSRDPSCGLYVEVPNGRQLVEELSVWDLIYEHCSYFTEPALRRVMAASGLAVASVRTAFGGQFLCAFGGVGTAPSEPPARGTDDDEIARLAARFAHEYEERVARWRGFAAGLRDRGATAAVWGSGSKGVAFLNALAEDADVFPHAVDVNPRKHGHFVAGAGQEIVPPERLRDLGPSAVVVSNAIYADEIRRALAELGVAADVLVA